MLIWFTQAEYFPFSMFKIDNGGISKHRGEDSDSVNYSDVDRMMSKINDRAEFYTKRFLDYICFNSNKYPEYNNKARLLKFFRDPRSNQVKDTCSNDPAYYYCHIC